MARIEIRNTLDQPTRDEILDLIEVITERRGHAPIGEQKSSHLRVGATDWLGVLAREQGGLVGYAHVRWGRAGERPRAAVEVAVHPDHRDDGTVAAQVLREAMAAIGRAGGGLVYLWVHHIEHADQTLAFDLGFNVQRELASMARELTTPPPPTTLPEGVDVRAYRPDVDERAFLEVNNAAFAGHPENGGWDDDDLAERSALEWFDPADVLMAWRGDELLGFHWTKRHEHGSDGQATHAPVGEVYVLAVHPRAQGLGLGRALLRAGMQHMYRRGCRRVMLYVDRADTTAVHLYEEAGFSLAFRDVCFERWVPARQALERPLSGPAGSSL